MLFQKGVNWNDYPAFFKRVLHPTRIVKSKASVEDPKSYRPSTTPG
jgi:hypothetical protein